MKFTVAALVIVGLIAAASAAVLAVTLKTPLGRNMLDPMSEEVDIIVAARDVPAMGMVESGAIATQRVKRADAPPNAITSAVQVIGRVLLVPVVEGQPFVATQFASSDSNQQLVQSIPEGSRAMSILLGDDSGIEDLLYPGSIVDVVASFRLPALGGGTSAEVVSVTLLQNIRVLAVGGRSVVSEKEGLEATGRRSRMVTLMVNTAQAEALQLAVTQGKVSVSLRNPLDTEYAEVGGTRISELSTDLAERIRRLAEQEMGIVPMSPPELARAEAAAATNTINADGSTTPANTDGTAASGSDTPTPRQAQRSATPVWQTTIIRGRSKEIQKFEVPEESPK